MWVGRHEKLKLAIKHAMVAAGLPVTDALRLPGVNPHNICNRGRLGMGVQLEISLGMRQQLFAHLARLQRNRVTPFFSAFVLALQRVINGVCRRDPP